ncbi:4442_t:CDS:2 [Entrophospora sp. SA101]|nr:4442_t:CDS:2 [Entrophospora sp. SA101]CAJ0898351.1 5071_t:CDS:2 [Entrophospora sp. SA101]
MELDRVSKHLNKKKVVAGNKWSPSSSVVEEQEVENVSPKHLPQSSS